MLVGAARVRLHCAEDGVHSSQITHKKQVKKKKKVCYRDTAGFLWLASPQHFCITEFRQERRGGTSKWQFYDKGLGNVKKCQYKKMYFLPKIHLAKYFVF